MAISAALSGWLAMNEIMMTKLVPSFARRMFSENWEIACSRESWAISASITGMSPSISPRSTSHSCGSMAPMRCRGACRKLRGKLSRREVCSWSAGLNSGSSNRPISSITRAMLVRDWMSCICVAMVCWSAVMPRIIASTSMAGFSTGSISTAERAV
ncbi:MAG: hypothetical protein R3C97_00580 [Geminicoccaceae bacterium]